MPEILVSETCMVREIGHWQCNIKEDDAQKDVWRNQWFWLFTKSNVLISHHIKTDEKNTIQKNCGNYQTQDTKTLLKN